MNSEIVWIGGKIFNMENHNVLSLFINILGLGILIWFLIIALIDLERGNKRRTIFHNLLIIGLCLIYSLKIILKDILNLI